MLVSKGVGSEISEGAVDPDGWASKMTAVRTPELK